MPAPEFRAEVVWWAVAQVAVVEVAVAVAVAEVGSGEQQVRLSTEQTYLQLAMTGLSLWPLSLPLAYEKHLLGFAAGFAGWMRR